MKDYVFENQSASLDELFTVPKNTLRRDVKELVELGKIKKFTAALMIQPLYPFMIEDTLKFIADSSLKDITPLRVPLA